MNNFDDDDVQVHENPQPVNKRKVLMNTFMNNAKARTVFIITTLIVILMLFIGYYNMNKSLTKKTGTNTNIQLTEPNSNIMSIPGTSTSESYNKLQDEENKLKVQKAKEKGDSYLSIPTNNIETNIKDPFEDITEEYKQKEVVKPMEEIKVPDIQMLDTPSTQPIVEQREPEPVVYQEPEYKEVNRNDNRHRNDSLTEQFNLYINKWAANKSFQEKIIDTSVKADMNNSSNEQQSNGYNSNNYNQVAKNEKSASFVKAGTIIPAELKTAINSDEPGPVLAKITTGPLSGAVLIGEVTHSNQAVVVRFNRITMEDHNQSYNINAYAVDTSTFRTHLASDVDNHYFLRYGLRLAAAFVEGYGDAIASSGATTTTSPFGSTTSVLGNYSNSQIVKMSAGKIGQQIGKDIDNSTSNLRPTVTVDSGLPIGVLFISDF